MTERNIAESDIEAILEGLVAALKRVPGIKAIVLGGSRARGTASPASDVDVGLYYRADDPLDLPVLRDVAAALDDRRTGDAVTEVGGWGPWINGGAWLLVQGRHVDLLYRDLDRVDAVLDAALHGRVEVDYQPGHPFGFVSSIYLGEAAVCRPLLDPEGEIGRLKRALRPYPGPLRAALVDRFRWEAGFAIETGRKSIERLDVAYAAGAAFRAVGCMTQVLFALNDEWWLNEKGAVGIADGLARRPRDYRTRVESALGLLSADPAALDTMFARLAALEREVAALVDR